MTEKIIIAGAGGQGIMLLGKVLAEAAMREDKYVTWFPSYGAEVRGGTAHCMVVISDNPIGSPYVDKADTLIIMNNPSLERFGHRAKDKGLLIINSSLAGKVADKNTHAFWLPFTDSAVNLGNIKVANMVALGLYLAQKNIVSKDTVLEIMKDMAPRGRVDLIEINKKALFVGIELIKR